MTPVQHNGPNKAKLPNNPYPTNQLPNTPGNFEACRYGNFHTTLAGGATGQMVSSRQIMTNTNEMSIKPLQ